MCRVNVREQVSSSPVTFLSCYCFFSFSGRKDDTNSQVESHLKRFGPNIDILSQEFSFGISVEFFLVVFFFFNFSWMLPFLFHCKSVRNFIAVIGGLFLILIVSLPGVQRNLSCTEFRDDNDHT